MKKFLSNILIFAILIGLTDLLYGKVCDGLLASSKKGIEKRVNDIIYNDSSDILVMGSSRAHYHYNPKVFTDSLGLTCYNAGFDGQGILFSYGLLKLKLENNIPKLVIYDVSTFDIYHVDDNSKYVNLLKPYYRREQLGVLFDAIDRSLPYKIHSGFYRYNSELIALLLAQRGSDTSRDNGFIPKNGGGEICVGYDKNYDESNLIVDTLKLEYICKLIELCKNEDVKLVFVASPRYMQPESTLYYSRVIEIANKKDIPFINYFSDLYFSKSGGLFYDASHMNSIGADEFSKEIAYKIKERI